MPYSTKNFSSFLRQLHFYGFRKTDRGKNAWEFSHAYFLKDKPELMSRIQRKNSSSNSNGGSNSGSNCESAESKAQRESIDELKGRMGALEGMLTTFSDQMGRLLRVIGPATFSGLSSAPASGEFLPTPVGNMVYHCRLSACPPLLPTRAHVCMSESYDVQDTNGRVDYCRNLTLK